MHRSATSSRLVGQPWEPPLLPRPPPVVSSLAVASGAALLVAVPLVAALLVAALLVAALLVVVLLVLACAGATAGAK